jgi:hypothetical protein
MAAAMRSRGTRLASPSATLLSSSEVEMFASAAVRIAASIRAGGAAVRLTPYLQVSGDIARTGEVVEWVNRDPVEHTVTADGGQWDSGFVRAGARYRRTFSEPGRYEYHCIPHPQMTAVVIVE